MTPPTALLEGPGTNSVPADPAAASGGPVARPLSEAGSWVLLSTFTTALALLFRYGYSYGLFDQTVYALRGVALADPSAYRYDWFARTVPQPHWLFDVITFLGARLGILPGVYVAYWLAGVVVFAIGSVWLARRFLPDHPALAATLGPLVVLGPSTLLGSTTPLLWFANPHMLGGCLAFLALCGLLTERWRAASLAALAAGAFHVQHGANLAPILLLTALLATTAAPRRRLLLAAASLVLLGGAAAVAQWRGLETTGDQWLTTCQRIIPFHCYAQGWSLPYLASGGVVLAAAAGFVWWARRSWHTVLPAVALPAAGLLLGVLSERFEVGALGRLAAQYNVHRLATLVEPFGAFALLCLVVAWPSVRGRRRAGRAALALVTIVVWSTMADSAIRGPQVGRALVVAGLTAGLLVWFMPRRSPWPRSRAIAAVAVLSIVTLTAAAGGSLGEVGYDRGLPTVRAALAIKRIVPDSAIIAAPPDMYWLRAISQRSIVADCKAVPYGGAPWDEYMQRMQALGGNCRGRAHGWESLTADDVEALRGRYGVTHVLLYDDDPKVDHARAHWRPVFRAEPEDVVFFERGFVLYDVAGPGRVASAAAG